MKSHASQICSVATAALLAVLASGCAEDAASGPGDADSGAEVPTVPLTLRFAVGGAVRTSRSLVDPLEGPVFGSIFHSADVALTGPVEGAVGLVSVFVESVDLRNDVQVSEASWETRLPAGSYTFLGFWDINHSAGGVDAVDPGPNNGDPVPLADTNQFTLVEGQPLEYTATFELVYAFD